MAKVKYAVLGCAALGLVLVPAMGQDADIDPALTNEVVWQAGPNPFEVGDILCGPQGVEVCTGVNGNLGVSVAGGTIFVSHRVAANSHGVTTFNASDLSCGGATVLQDSVCQTSSWGYRDGTTDGTFLYFGCESGMARHDLDGSNAATHISGPAPGGVGTWRGLAYDPALDGGNGGFWTASFGSSLVTTTMNGTLIDVFSSQGWSIYGIALDPNTGNLWVNSNPNAGQICEIDRNGALTGLCFDRGMPGTAQGGLEGGEGICGSTGWDMVGLDQATPDSITGYDGGEAPPAGCEYKVAKNSKGKKGCTACYKKGDLFSTGDPCAKVGDCKKKIKEKKYDCLDGGPGFCKKLKAKRNACLE